MATETQVKQLIGCKIIGSNGEEIGKVGQVYLNDASRQPEWVTVRTGLFGMRESFVPLRNARHVGEELHVPYDKAQVKEAPHLDAGQHLSVEEESQLYRHYGLGQPRVPVQPLQSHAQRHPSELIDSLRGDGGFGGVHDSRFLGGPTTPPGPAYGRPDGEAMYDPALAEGRPGAGDLMMTRFEERLRIGKENHEAGRVRIRKYVEVEQSEDSVQLIREEIVIEREQITDVDAGEMREIGEEEREIILHEERPVVTTEAYPVERLRVRVRQVPTEEKVQGQIRKERIEVDHDDHLYGSESRHPEQDMPLI
ncbi:MAG TPA: PRC and DUF2382 domain-containing protein [Thermopolyspora sp.]